MLGPTSTCCSSVDDEATWLDDLAWVDAIGPSWLGLVNESPLPSVHVVQVLFAGGYDVDFVPVGRELLASLTHPDAAAEMFGHGARVVVDRIGAFDELLGPTGTFPGVFSESSKLEVWIPPHVAVELPATFAQYDDVSIAQTLVRGHALFRRLAREVADHRGYRYPEAADARIEAWVRDRLAESPLGALDAAPSAAPGLGLDRDRAGGVARGDLATWNDRA